LPLEMIYRPSPLAETLVIPSVWPGKTPDGRVVESERRSLHVRKKLLKEDREKGAGEGAPDFDHGIVRPTNQDISGRGVGPATTIHVIRVCRYVHRPSMGV
jgi:hypothetical protein